MDTEVRKSRPYGPFNSVLETGVRSVFLLNALYPLVCDLDRLVALDHFVVHTSDLGGPESLHPATSSHAAEMLVRRKLVQDGLLLMQSRLLVERAASTTGFVFRAGPEAQTFVNYLDSPYFFRLRVAARYISEFTGQMSDIAFEALVDRQLERWAIQFQVVSSLGSAR